MDITVKFIKNHSPYAVGDIAGFDNKKANWLERAGMAEKIEEGEKDASNNSRKGKKLSSNRSK